MPVTTTRPAPRVIGPASRCGPSPRGRRRRAGRGPRSRSRPRACRTPSAGSRRVTVVVVDVDERPRCGRVAVEDVARRAVVDDDLPAEVADLGQVGVAAADHPGIGPRDALDRRPSGRGPGRSPAVWEPGDAWHTSTSVSSSIRRRRSEGSRRSQSSRSSPSARAPTRRRRGSHRGRRRSSTGRPRRSRSPRPRRRCCPR